MREPAPENLCGMVSRAFAAQRIGMDYPGIRHRPDRSSDVFAAALAGDSKADSGFLPAELKVDNADGKSHVVEETGYSGAF